MVWKDYFVAKDKIKASLPITFLLGGVTIFHLHWHNAKVFTLRAYKDKRVMVGVCQYHYRVTKISCKDRTQSLLSLSWYMTSNAFALTEQMYGTLSASGDFLPLVKRADLNDCQCIAAPEQ